MAGMMSGLEADSFDRKYTDRELYRRILQLLGSRRKRIYLLAGVIFAQSAAGAGVPVLLSRSIDLLAENQNLGRLLLISAVVMALGGLDWTLNYFSQRTSSRAIGDMVANTRHEALSSTLRRDMRFFDQNISGKLISRITSDTQELGTLVTLFADILSSGLMVVLVTAVMLTKTPWLTLATLSIVPLILLATVLFRTVARRMSTQSRRILAVLNGQIQESVSGISVAKGFRQEQAVYEAFQANNQQSYQITLRQGWTFNTIFPLLNMVFGLTTALLVYLGGLKVLDASSGISAGDWYFFLQSVGMIFFPLISLASFYGQLQSSLSATERVFALLDQESELKQQVPGKDPGRLRGELELRDVHFQYREGEPVFQGLNLHIPAGQSVALVGHTGAGKSSIVNLLARYYEFQQGDIRVDGQDLRSLELGAWRKQLGIILQEALLFDASVADNIRYGSPDASDEAVREALKRIGAEHLEHELPEGLSTMVRERGARLSLGQRQLISLARATMQDPAILILDEATASVDPLTEVRIQKALDRVMEGRTTLVIAHRLVTVRHVDRIVALDHGRILEEGSHEALLARGEYYARLYQTYFRHQSLEYIEQVEQLAG